MEWSEGGEEEEKDGEGESEGAEEERCSSS